MEKTRRLRIWGGFLLLLLLLLIFLIWNILAGSVRLPASEIWTILQGGGELSQRRILLQIRLPRLLAALILGGALSVSGYLLQTFFHNPIAGPFVLGISSGAKLRVSVTMVGGNRTQGLRECRSRRTTNPKKKQWASCWRSPGRSGA